MDDFVRILKEPKNALAKQYTALLETEGIKLTLSDDALQEVARFAAQVNETSENIGARRLHTIMEKLLEEISFEGPDLKKKNVKVDSAYVRRQLADIGLRRIGRIAGRCAIERATPAAAAIAIARTARFATFAGRSVERLATLAGTLLARDDRRGCRRLLLRLGFAGIVVAVGRIIALLVGLALRLELRLRRLGRGKPIVDRLEIIVVLILRLAELVDPPLVLRLPCRNDAEVMLGMLQVIFGQHRVT